MKTFTAGRDVRYEGQDEQDEWSIRMDTDTCGTSRRALTAWMNEAMREAHEARLAGDNRKAAGWQAEADRAQYVLTMLGFILETKD